LQGDIIRKQIDSFGGWHYPFDLMGHQTPVRHPRLVNRHEQRKKYFIEPLVRAFGGSLEGKRVLDLASNAGYWSLASVEAGCDYVLGIEGRQMHIEQAEFVFSVKEVDQRRYDFVCSDIFKIDFTRFGRFDIVLCLGLFYHVSKHVELLEKIEEVNEDLLVIDTEVARGRGSWMKLRGQNPKRRLSAVDRTLAMTPTKKAVHDLAKELGYEEVVTLEPDFRDEHGEPSWRGARDYRNGKRRAFVCSKLTDISLLPVKVEPL
jgi:tRNA (mo5U34)-methyltransferase